MQVFKTTNNKTLVACRVIIPDNQYYYLATLAKQQNRTVSMVLESIIDEVMQNGTN